MTLLRHGTIPLVTVLCLALVGCGNSGSTKNLSLHGGWVTNTWPASRGSFTLTASAHVQDATRGPLTGTLQLFDEHGGLTASEPVTGQLLFEGTGNANLYWDLTFSSAGGVLSFSASCYDGVDSSSVMVGSFTDARSGATVAGRWHNSPAGGPSEAVIDRVFHQSGFSILDLAWNGSKLLAVATPAGETTGVFELDISGATLSTTPVTLSPAVTAPTGVAWDGVRAWIVSSGPNFTFQLNAYDATWADALAGSPPRGPGGSPRDQPSWIAAWDGALWTADVLSWGATRIDPSTAAKTTVTSLILNRPVGADFDGTLIWSASYPPGGVWPSLDAFATAGPLVRSIYAPEDVVGSPAPVAVACETNGFIWVAYGENVYRLDAR